ncbi:MAG: hypothetical protein ACK41O_08535 [Runella zeae]
MKHLMLFWVLTTSTLGPLFAQTEQYQITIPLSTSNRVVIAGNRWDDFEKFKNLDSLVRLFVEDYQKVKDSISNPTTAYKLQYTLNSKGRQLRIQAYPQTQNSFIFQNFSEPMLVKQKQDTIVIEKWIPHPDNIPPLDQMALDQIQAINGELHNEYRYNRYGHWFGIYFLLNNADEIMQITQLNERLASTLEQLKKTKTYDRHNAGEMTFRVFGPERFNVKAEVAKSWKASMSLIWAQTSLGFYAGRPYTTIGGDFTYLYKNSILGLNLGVEMAVSFNKTQTDNFAAQRSTFYTVGINFYDRGKKIEQRLWGTTSKHLRVGSLQLGYNRGKEDGHFQPHTWRFSSAFTTYKRITVMPEIYWNGFFKNIKPGLRVAIGF